MEDFLKDLQIYQLRSEGDNFNKGKELTKAIESDNSDAVKCIQLLDRQRNLTQEENKNYCDSETEKQFESRVNEKEILDRNCVTTDNSLILTDPPDINEILSLDQNLIQATPHNVSILNAACQNVLKQMEHMLLNQLKKNRKEQEIVLNYLNKNEKCKSSEVNKKNNIKCLGIPYFKDTEGYPPPLNQDVISKKKSNKLLPVDFITGSYVWSTKDFTMLKKAVVECQSSNSASNSVIDPNTVDWMKVSATHMDGKYSALECKALWVMFLRPEVNKAPWAAKEIKHLRELAAKYKQQDWDKIAEELGTNRTSFQCCVKHQTNKPIVGDRWTKAEDNALLQIIKTYKIKDYIPWKKVAWNFKGRSLRQCQERYAYHLQDIKKGTFTSKEDYVLIYLYSKLKSFKEVAKYFPKRVSTQIRARYDYLVKLTMREFSKEEDKLLIELMKKYPRNWTKISEHFDDRTNLQCRYRWSMLQKTMSLTDDNLSENEGAQESLSSRKCCSRSELDSAVIDQKISQFSNSELRQKGKKKFSEPYQKLLDYCQPGYKFLLGPKPRLPTHSEEKDRLCANMRITMKHLYVNSLNSNFGIDSLADNCEFNDEDFIVLESIKKWQELKKEECVSICHRVLPPNYMTLVGLRTLLLGSNNIRNLSIHYKPSCQSSQIEKSERILFSDAKRLFKLRLKSLFAFPIIMSNISQSGIAMNLAPVKKVKRSKPLSKRKRKLHAKKIQSFKKKIETAVNKKLVKSGKADVISNNQEIVTESSATVTTVESFSSEGETQKQTVKRKAECSPNSASKVNNSSNSNSSTRLSGAAKKRKITE